MMWFCVNGPATTESYTYVPTLSLHGALPIFYDGALPFRGGGKVEPHGTTSRVRSEQPVHFGSMFNVQRLLEGEKLDRVIDAMQPGGSGQPFEGLTSHEREELAALYRLGDRKSTRLNSSH